MTRTAGEILELLADRHAKDVFVPECKTGPTVYGAGHVRIDAWAMAKSWANPCFTAYEVKVARGDFVQDTKWRAYLDYCTEFYFVCPWDLIQPDELPKEAGLLWASKTGSRLFVKKKAPHRDVEIPRELLYYILMWRSRITRKDAEQGDRDRQYWEEWLEKREIDREFGWRVGRAIGKRVKEEIVAVREENERLERRIEVLSEIETMLGDLGVTPDAVVYLGRHRVKQALDGNAKTLVGDLKRAAQACEDAWEQLTAYCDGAAEQG